MASVKTKLSTDEVALYDRQIRLWGMGTQLRLMSAKILVINLSGIGTEVVKNLVLGGINTIEILDSSRIIEEDFSAQFFLPNEPDAIGKLKLPLAVNNIKDLNTRVNLAINTENIDDILVRIEKAKNYLSRFDLIIGTELSKSTMLKLNEYTRNLKIPLYVTAMHGMFGYIFTDLIEHVSLSERDVGNHKRVAHTFLSRTKEIIDVKYDGDKEVVSIRDTYIPLAIMLTSKELKSQLNRRQMKRLSGALPLLFSLLEFPKPNDVQSVISKEKLKEISRRICKELEIPENTVNDEYLNLFSCQAFTEFAPVAAVLGGCLSQDVIQFLSKKESPINNCLVFDALKSEMPIYSL